MIHCAIIGDIVGSKKIKNRQETQDHFKEVLKTTNQKYDKYIASNFTVTLGDEFQGLLFNPSISFEIIEFIKERMYPIEFVFGIGIGRMETDFTKNSSIGSDGPAYWYARKMVTKAKNKEPSVCFYSNSPEDPLIDSLILFSESCFNARTEKQQKIVKLYKELGSQKMVAERLSISQSAVSKHLDKAFFSEINRCNKNITHFLKDKWE